MKAARSLTQSLTKQNAPVVEADLSQPSNLHPGPLVGQPQSAATKLQPIKQQPALGQDIDALLELRSLIKKAGEQERILTQSILSTLSAAGLDTFSGAQATAVLGSRTVLTPDPQLFLEALGEKAFGALRVSVENARALMIPADLEAISETVTGPVLRVVPLKGKVA